MAIVEIPVTISGSVVTAEDASARDFINLVTDIDPIQDLHGYDHPWPAGGGPNLWNTSTALYHYSIGSNTDVVAASSNARMAVVPCEAGNSYTATKSGGSRMAVCFIKDELPSSGNIPAYNIVRDNASTTLTSTAPDGALYFCAYVDLTSSGDTRVDTSSVKLSVTSNICPISGHTEVNVYHEEEYDAGADPAVTVSWENDEGTVYGGNYDVLNGVLTVTDANIASYNGETLPSTWISSLDAYALGATPTTGAQVVYKLETPLTYQLTGTTMTATVGTNVVWSDTGDVTLTYYRSVDMALSTMYPSKNGSPKTTLASGITASATEMTLDDTSVLPPAPNLAVLGEDANAEIVLYNGIAGNAVTGMVRGINGTTASSWPEDTVVARNFTSYDHDTIIGNITDLDTYKAPLESPTFTGTPTTPTASLATDTTQIASTAFVQLHAPIHLSVTASAGNAITKSDARITSTMRVINIAFGTPSNVTTDITWTTSTGSVTFNATFAGSTTIDFDLVETN